MPKSVSDNVLQAAVNAQLRYGDKTQAAKMLGISRNTLNSRLQIAELRGTKASKGAPTEDSALRARVKALEHDLKVAGEKGLTHDTIKRAILTLAEDAAQAEPPRWTIDAPAKDSSPGVPTLFVSDLHWGEVVDPRQINGVNKYNMKIARARLREMGRRAVQLLRIISPKMDYPGIVIPLGGDNVSGNIHDELTATNELNSMPVLLDVMGEMIALVNHMLTVFGRVFMPCVSGNHGRNTQKIWGKDRHHTSFDWLLYQLLAKHFEADKRITFLIPDGPDAYYKVYGTRYLLTHGDQFRGGDGLIGALGPIIRGDHRKRSRNSQIDMEYDTLLLGHFHQYMHLTRLIVNGSLKGLDEYAYGANFPFEYPQQALWLTHPAHGITFRMPVFLQDAHKTKETSWVSVTA